MAKRKFTLSQDERGELIQAYRVSKDVRTRIRYKALLLYAQGTPETEIERAIGCCRTSLMEWCRAYRAEHLQGLVDKRNGRNRAKLSESQVEALKQMLHQQTPKSILGQKSNTTDGQLWTVKDLVLVIRERYGIVYESRSAYYRIFNLCGLHFQKTEKVFRPRSEAKVAKFE